MSVVKSSLIAGVSMWMALGADAQAAPIDWSKVEGKDITLFYPAQMSWEAVLNQADHSGASKFREGKDCRACHEDEERASGGVLVAEPDLEPDPIKGKPGFLDMVVKIAHDAERLYVHVEFKTDRQPDAAMDKIFETKVAMMIDDGKISEAARAGCWTTCHDNMTRMHSAGEKEVTKYLARSRVEMTRQGGDRLKPAADIEKMRGAGEYMEYWQARLRPGQPADVVDGIVLEKRAEHSGPVVAAEAAQVEGKWAVTFSRKLTQAGAFTKDFVPGKTYTVGFSVHAGHTAHRFHYVSLEKTLVLDAGKADFVVGEP